MPEDGPKGRWRPPAGARHDGGVTVDPGVLAEVLESAADAVLIVDATGAIRCAQVTVTLGWPAEDLLGRPVEVLVPTRAKHVHRGHRARQNSDEAYDVAARLAGRLFPGLSGALSAVFRDDGVVCRFGGEEFTVVLAGAGADAALQRTEAFRARLRDLRVPYLGLSLPAPTASAGLACLPRDGRTGSELVRAADRALYAAPGEGVVPSPR